MTSWPLPATDEAESHHASLQQQQQQQPQPLASTSSASDTAEASKRQHVIDLDQINASFQHWLGAIKLKHAAQPRELDEPQQLDICESVFTPFAPALPYNPDALPLRTMDDQPPTSEDDFMAQVQRVQEAIAHGVHPRLNPKGSSGSYFCKDLEGHIVGIFKPKDEEPYGRLNPKWTKWFHRHFVAPVFGFGRSCLIPNLSYLSEEAASVLDRRLQTHIVPRTQVVALSSTAFFYDWMDRRAAKGKRPRPLPAKSGSFQLFGKGFTDASVFLSEHRWPGVGEPPADAATTGRPPKHPQRGLKVLKLAQKLCGRAEAAGTTDDDDKSWSSSGEEAAPQQHPDPRGFVWTRSLMSDTRHQLERLVVLDYLMRNTDRGLDNFMLRVCRNNDDGFAASDQHAAAASSSCPQEGSVVTDQPGQRPAMSQVAAQRPPSALLRQPKSVVEVSDQSHTHLLAIDNSLAFPQHHPRGWRSFAYGWLWLPVSMIGVPWSRATREHFLALLTDKTWWQDTSDALRRTFAKDPDFNARQFEKQMALIKGQGLNLVKSLKNPTEGPLELCQRQSCLVWDDVIAIPHTSSLNHFDLTQSLHGELPVDASAEESAPLLSGPAPSSSSRRMSRFARRFRRSRGKSSSQEDQDGAAPLPRQLSSKEHAESTTEDGVASGFSLLDSMAKSSRRSSNNKKKSRSASFGTMPDLGERRRSHEDATDSGWSRPGHVRFQSSVVHPDAIAEVMTRKRAIVERVELVHQKPYFAVC